LTIANIGTTRVGAKAIGNSKMVFKLGDSSIIYIAPGNPTLINVIANGTRIIKPIILIIIADFSFQIPL